MSRIGKTPIKLPNNVKVIVADDKTVNVEGPKGRLSWILPLAITLRNDGENIVIERGNELRTTRALHGLARALVNNMVHGVYEGFRRDLEIQGVGFRASVKGEHLDLSIGYSHPILFKIPKEI